MKKLVIVLVACMSYFVQAQVFPLLFQGTWMPNLLLAWMGAIAMVKGRRPALFAAAGAGIVQDVLISNVFGLHLLPYIAGTFVLTMRSGTVYKEQWYMSALAVLFLTLIDGAMQFGMILVGDLSIGFEYIVRTVLPTGLPNAALASCLHRVVWSMERREEYHW